MTVSEASDDASVASISAVRRNRRVKSNRRAALEWVVAIGLAVTAALGIKTWLVQAFVIPSESMLQTLQRGDRVLVSKFAYRISDVRRGDVIVFKNPTPPARRAPDEPGQLIKRVVAVEGDTLRSEGGNLVVNEREVVEPYLVPGTRTEDCCTRWMASVPRTAATAGAADLGDGRLTVPAGMVFVMGDNRGNSKDSRYIGPIDRHTIVGKAFLRMWPIPRIGRL